jgi:hypothetical protein
MPGFTESLLRAPGPHDMHAGRPDAVRCLSPSRLRALLPAQVGFDDPTAVRRELRGLLVVEQAPAGLEGTRAAGAAAHSQTEAAAPASGGAEVVPAQEGHSLAWAAPSDVAAVKGGGLKAAEADVSAVKA